MRKVTLTPVEDEAPVRLAPTEEDNGRIIDGVPAWGRENPNLYAAAMTALDAIPAAASVAAKAKVGIPVAAALGATTGAIKRSIEGKPQTTEDMLLDAAKTAGLEGVGRGVGTMIQKAMDIPAVQQTLGNLGEKLYASAMKFSTSPKVLNPAERKAIIKTGLENDFMPNEESYLRLQGKVRANTGAVDDIIEQGTAAGDTIPADTVIEKGGLADLMARGQQIRGAAPAYTDDVNRVVDTFRQGEKSAPYTPNDINASKRQIYQEIEDAYRQGTLSNAGVQSKKQLAAGMKTVLEDMYPEIAKLNANSKDLLDLSDHLARSLGRIGNRDIIGLGDKIVMDTVASIPQGSAAAPRTFWGAVISTLDRPAVKARLAQVLYKANTGKDLPLSQWKRGMQYVGRAANSAPARGAIEAYMLTDPLGLRNDQ